MLMRKFCSFLAIFCSLLAGAAILSACSSYKSSKLESGSEAKFQAIDIQKSSPFHYSPMFYDVIEGEPKFTLWRLEDDGDIKTGVWEATKGKWKFKNSHWEYCRIISGVSIVTEDGGEAHTVKASDSFVLRPGFSGTREVIETTRKDYVIRE